MKVSDVRRLPTSRVPVNGTYEWLPVRDLCTDVYQRPLDRRRVKKMVETFDADAFGDLEVSRRESGKLVLIDGQHRVAVINALGWGDQTVHCHVHDDLSLADEARIFRKMTEDRKSMRSIQLFQCRIIEGDPTALEILATLKSLGLTMGDQGSAGVVHAVRAVEQIYRDLGVQVLRGALSVALEAWGNGSEGLQGEVLKGVALVLHDYVAELDVPRLVNRLSRVRPATLLSDAKMVQRQNKAGTVPNIASGIVGQYNTGRQSNHRLAEYVPRSGQRTSLSGLRAPHRSAMAS